jgi:hypothetical protein
VVLLLLSRSKFCDDCDEAEGDVDPDFTFDELTDKLLWSIDTREPAAVEFDSVD